MAFHNQPHLAVYICIHVFRNVRPVRFVTHEDDGDWVFGCGETDHQELAAEWRLVGISHLLDRDGTLAALDDMPTGWGAEWDPLTLSWSRAPLQDDG
jgi:hypothetical protein